MIAIIDYFLNINSIIRLKADGIFKSSASIFFMNKKPPEGGSFMHACLKQAISC